MCFGSRLKSKLLFDKSQGFQESFDLYFKIIIYKRFEVNYGENKHKENPEL